MIGKSLGLIEKKQNREDLKQMKLRNSQIAITS